MANFLLVYPSPAEFKNRRFGFSLDLLYLSSFLKEAGHNIISLLDYSIEPFNEEKFYADSAEADLIVIEFDSFPLKRSINILHGEQLVRSLVNRYGRDKAGSKKIILFGDDVDLSGGGYPSLEYDYALPSSLLNNIGTVAECLLGGQEVPSLRPLDDADRRPFPDRGLLTPYAEHGGAVDREPGLQKSTLLRTSAGCLNSCVFCQRKGWQKNYRPNSIPYVLKEFSELKRRRYRNIWVTDDNFTFDLKRAKGLLKELAARSLTEGMKVALSSWTRIDEEFLEAARSANVSIISFGVESAVPGIQEFYRKKINLERFGELIRFADRIGLYTVGNFIIGAPMETEATIEETFSYIIGTPFDRVNVKILDYMAGSVLYEGLPPEKKRTGRHIFACKENGLNDFPLVVLRGKIKMLYESFQHTRESRLKEKISRYGPPYYHIR